MDTTHSTKSFPLADILSVTTLRLLSRRRMDGLTDLLDWMTGDSLEPWQLKRAADACTQDLLQQYPWLSELTPPAGLSDADLYRWLTRAEVKHGHDLTITPLTEWTHQEPVQEFRDRVDLARLFIASSDHPRK